MEVSSRTRRILGQASRFALVAAVLLSLAKLGRVVHDSSPIQTWLIWRFAAYWLLTLGWAFACLVFGHAVLVRLIRVSLPILERVTQSFAVGVLAFFLLMFAGGLAFAYGPVLFYLLPALMLAAGAPDSVRYVRRLFRHLRARRPGPDAVLGPGALTLWGVGFLLLALLYGIGLTPETAGYDTRWYHLPMAEHYVAQGGIARFPEGWQPGAVAHLPSLLYAWAYQLPWRYFDRVQLASHLELAALLMTLPGIPALVRRLVRGTRVHGSWVFLFTFPSVYYYGRLIGGDQIAMLWAAPIALALLRSVPALPWRHGVVLGAMLAGLALTKYSAGPLLVGPVLAVAIATTWRFVRSCLDRSSLRDSLSGVRGGFAAGAAALVLTTPLWLKNWIWHADPVFPLLHTWFSPRPWTQDAPAHLLAYEVETAGWHPTRDWAGVRETLLAMFTHAFATADYAASGQTPVPLRGSLLVLLSAALPFVRASARPWGTVALVYLTIAGWYWLYHQDRYLLAFTPLMAAAVAALAVSVWRSTRWARPPLVALLALHTAFSATIFCRPEVINRYRQALSFLGLPPDKAMDASLSKFQPWRRIGFTLPRKAKVLIHQQQVHAGLTRMSVNDWPPLQTGLSYGRMRSAAAMHETLRAMGVSHILWKPDTPSHESVAGDLRFFEFVHRYTKPVTVDGFLIAELPAKPPRDEGDAKVAVLGCGAGYSAGVYPFSALTVVNPFGQLKPPYPAPEVALGPNADLGQVLSQVRYIVHNPACGFALPAESSSCFAEVGHRKDYTLLARVR